MFATDSSEEVSESSENDISLGSEDNADREEDLSAKSKESDEDEDF